MSIVEKLTKRGKVVDDFIFEMLKMEAATEMYEIVKHQILSGGKRIRPAMTIYCCEAVGGSVENAIPAGASIELIHNYTLILDDIIDRSNLRRGNQTVRALYSDVMALLAGMHYREAVSEAIRRSPEYYKLEGILNSTIRKIIEGERLDVLFEQVGRDSKYINKMRYNCISENEYFQMVEAKTAVLFETACMAGCIVGGGDEVQLDALSKYGMNCGMAFQILDDILDITGTQGQFGKEIGKDIKEHKLGNILILYALKELSPKDHKELLGIIRSSSPSDSRVKTAIDLILTTNSVKKAHEQVYHFVNLAKSNINSVTLMAHERDILISLADYLAERSF